MDNTHYIDLFEKYLKGNADVFEIRLLISWLQSQGFENWTTQQWKESVGFSEDFDDQKRRELFERIKNEISVSEIEPEIPQKHLHRKLYLNITRVAAVILLVICTGIGVYQYAGKQKQLPDMTVFAERGQKAKLALPDGSVVWLNSDSEIRYGSRFDKRERVVSITGEAYFEIAKDPKRPFIVQTPGLKVKVHGTTFNINTYNTTETKVALLEGSVEILTGSNSSTMLKPNEMAVYNTTSNRISIEKNNVMYAFDWKNNRIRFKDESLESITTQLARSFNMEVNIKSEELKKRRFTGDFSHHETVEQIFDIMSSNNKINYSIKGNKIEIY